MSGGGIDTLLSNVVMEIIIETISNSFGNWASGFLGNNENLMAN